MMKSDHPSTKPVSKARRLLVGVLLAVWLAILTSLGATLGLYSLGVVTPALSGIVIIKSLRWVICSVFVAVLVVAWRRRQLRALFRGTALSGYVWGSILLCSLVALFYRVERWRGKQAWKQFEQELVAKGETLDLASVMPPSVPDEQNFAQAPGIGSLFDVEVVSRNVWRWHDPAVAPIGEALRKSGTQRWDDWGWQRQEPLDLREWTQQFCKATDAITPKETNASAVPALLALEPYRALLAAVQRACERPFARFSPDPKHDYPRPDHSMALVQALCELLAVRAVAELEAGQSDAALQDVRTGLRLARLAAQQPFWGYPFSLLHPSCWPLQPLWEGLAKRQWNDAQLVVLQEELAPLQPLAHHGVLLRFDCLLQMNYLEQLTPSPQLPASAEFAQHDAWGGSPATTVIRWIHPTGWAYQNQASIYRCYWQATAAVDVAGRRVDLSLAKRRVPAPSPDPLYVYFISPQADHFAPWLVRHAAYAQTVVDLAFVACALERHRLAHGQLPSTLESLASPAASPDSAALSHLPKDVFTGQALTYRLMPDGNYQLYGVGWNGADDGGDPALARNWQGRLKPRLEKGDWTWGYVKVTDLTTRKAR